jgi:3-hydroxyacyl-[acyl-carrier-protein] dehydratase
MTIFDSRAIMALLPHRFPMLLVDRLEILEPGVAARGWKGVTINEPFFAGHFPSRPIMPGVLIVEALAQAAGVLSLHAMAEAGRPEDQGKLVYFMAIEQAKFRVPVEPGCLLELNVRCTQARGRVSRFEGRAEVAGKLAAEANFTAMVADPPA